MTAMAVLLGILFIGITVVAHAYQILPTVGDIPTTVSLVAASVVRRGIDPVRRLPGRRRR